MYLFVIQYMSSISCNRRHSDMLHYSNVSEMRMFERDEVTGDIHVLSTLYKMITAAQLMYP